VFREGNPDADTLRGPPDFLSPDSFNYVTLEISADGKSLNVDTWGVDSYPPNRFPEPNEIAAPRRILGFRIEAACSLFHHARFVYQQALPCAGSVWRAR